MNIFGQTISTPSAGVLWFLGFIFIFMLMIIGFIIIMLMLKRMIKVNLFRRSAGKGGFTYLRMRARRFKEDGIIKLKVFKTGIIDKKIFEVEQKYIYPNKKGKDTINLMQDSSGIVHSLRIPEMEDVVDYYAKSAMVNEIFKKYEKEQTATIKVEDLRNDYEKKIKDLKETNFEVFFEPNVHETLEGIARQVQKGTSKFGSFMEKYGAVALVVTAMVISLLMIIMSFIFSNKNFTG